MSEFQSTKIFLLEAILQIGLKKFLSLKKVKNTVSWTYVISDLNGEEIIGGFYEKELPKTNQKDLRIEKVGKETNCMSNGKDIIILLIAGLIKKDPIK